MPDPGSIHRLSPLFSWRGAICDSDLPPTSRHVALTLSLHMNERGGSCFPAQSTLARETGLSVETVRDHLLRLSVSGWLIKEQEYVKGKPGSKNQYTATIPGSGAQTPTASPGTGVLTPTGSGVLTPTPIEDEDVSRGRTPNPQGGRRKIPRIVTELEPDERPEDFDRFWSLYPRKDSKNDARKAWLQVLDTIPPMEELEPAVLAIEPRISRLHPTTPEWRKFIKYPAAWLRAAGWEDERPAPVATPAEVARNCAVCGLSPIGDASGCLIEFKGLGDLDACPWRKK